MRTTIVVAMLVLTTLAFAPTAEAKPDDPQCHDRSPILDLGVVEVWLTRSCQPKVVLDQPSCTVGDIRFC